MSLVDKKMVRKLMAQGKLNSVDDIHEILKEQFGDILKEMLEAEMDEHLGYSKYDSKNKDTENSRNGENNTISP